MENVKRCPTCFKSIISEEEFTHKCSLDVIDIPVSDVFTSNKQDYESVIGFGLNGKYYRFIKSILASDDLKHDKFSDANGTEPASGNYKSYSKIAVILNMPSKNYVHPSRQFPDISQTFHLEVS